MVRSQVISVLTSVQDRVKQMKILYYALNFELYKVYRAGTCKFLLVTSGPSILGPRLHWTLRICTKVVWRPQPSSVHLHDHFNTDTCYHSNSVSIALFGVGSICITT